MFIGLLALAVACIFVGAALYVNFVEQPSRLALDDRAMVAEWAPSDRRGFVMQASLALLSAILAVITYREANDVRWLIGAIIILASWPYTFFVVVPLNNRLLAISKEKAGSNARDLIRSWGLLEWGHTLLGLWAAATFLWALA
ncbi:DUF1772 domain-containing protein [Roseiarcaceae bacterium H3SJ34-1]|uniref:DUF1772 domain-containing protein n=1 Tax=Terripilifer ovatus TaxID=3032367 RepID=UPI003AB925DC|nr:DUF1772 domain-containing protein [Roseiarcaceae bacterium H3SJ34-1]